MGRRLRIPLAYGDGSVDLRLEERNCLGILNPEPVSNVRSLGRAVREALEQPIGCPGLAELIGQKKAASVLVLVSDHTRVVPGYHKLLNTLFDLCLAAGVPADKLRMLIACGSHRPPDCDEREVLYGKRVMDLVQVYAHDCDKDCVSLGLLSTGHQLAVNKLLLTSDLVIATGKITPHYLAGFSGGRKALLPGCASRDSIAANHAMVARLRNGPGILAGNPLHQEMDEAADKAGIGFLVNVVPTPAGRPAGVFAGHWQKAWSEGVALCRRAWGAGFERQADCVVASAGGHPLDINLYQLQRVLNSVAPAVRPGGTIVLVGRCREGVGQEQFGQWLKQYTVAEILAMPEEGIVSEAHRAYATALVLERNEVCLVSDLEPAEAARMRFRGFGDLSLAAEYLAAKHGPDFGCYVVPKGSAVLLEESVTSKI